MLSLFQDNRGAQEDYATTCENIGNIQDLKTQNQEATCTEKKEQEVDNSKPQSNYQVWMKLKVEQRRRSS